MLVTTTASLKRRLLSWLRLNAALVCLCTLSLGGQAQAVRYVKATANGTGDGSSWANASADLQAMINASPAGNQVWVAGGRYTTTLNNGSFVMKSEVAIYGGFAGSETALSQRPAVNPVSGSPSASTLTGSSTGGSVVLNDGNNLDYSAVLDGFVISGGYTSYGGGLYISNSSPSLNNCVIRDNTAAIHGGGIYNDNSSPKLTNCVLSGNSARSFGGGIYNERGSLRLINCVLSGNSARSLGGGIYNFKVAGRPYLVNCVLAGNTAQYGGGIYNNAGVPYVFNCTLTANRAPSGAALWNEAGGNPQLVNSILWDNQEANNTAITNFPGATIDAAYCLIGQGETEFSSYYSSEAISSPFAGPTNYQLSPCSVAINAGQPNSLAEYYFYSDFISADLAGNPRFFQNGRIDIGAYESQGQPTLLAITSQPPSASSVTVGSSVSASASASGSVSGYQWYKNTLNTPVSGQTSATLTLTNLQLSDAGSYLLVVTGTCNSVTATAFSLSVSPQVTGAPTLDSPAPGATTNGLPLFAGGAPLGSTVTIVIDGTSSQTLTTTASNSRYSVSPTTPLASGSYSAYATAQLAGQTTSPASSTTSFTVDNTPPTVSLISAAGTSGSTTPTTSFAFAVIFSEPVTGFSAAGIGVSNGSVTSGPAGSGAGPYVFQVTPTLPGQPTTVSLLTNAAQDGVGNPSQPTAAYVLTYQLPVTGLPTLTSPAGGTTTSGQPVFSGTAPSGSTVSVVVGGVSSQTLITTATNGTFSVAASPALPSGSYSVYAVAQLSGQAPSPASTTNAFTVDNTAPAVVLTASVASGATTMSQPASFTVTFSEPVTGFDAAKISVSNGSVSNFTGSGASYRFTVTANTPGQVSVSLAANVARDGVGNANSAATAYSFTYQPPVTGAPTLSSPANGTLTNNNRPTYVGTAPSSSTVTVYVNNASVGTAQAIDGRFALEQPTALSDGVYQVFASAQLPGQATSPPSAINSVTIDATPPTVALTASVAQNTTTMSSPVSLTASFSEAVTGFSLAGISVTNGSVSELSGSGAVYRFLVTPASNGELRVAINAGAAQDQATNPNTTSALYSLTFLAPTITLAPASLPTGTQGTDYSQTLTASGGTSPYTYAITAGALPAGLTLASNGTLSGTPAANGSFTFTVTATDASTAPGPYTGAQGYTLTINPQPQTVAPVVTTPANGSFLNTATPTYSGAAPAGSTVTVYVDNTSIGTTTASTGNWSLTQPTALGQGNHQVRATAQRSGQAVSGNSNQNSFTVDTVAPTVVINSSAGASGSTTGTTPIPFTVTFSEPVTGFVAADLTVSGGSIANFAGSGTSYTFDVTPAADGLITVEVPANVAQDGVNNGNTVATPFSITYSRPVTATPVVVMPANGSVTTSTKPTYTGTATALASLSLVVDDNTATSQTTTVDASGNWTLTQLTDLAPGAHTVQARAQLAGQTVSAYSTVNSFTVVVLSSVFTATPTGVTSSGATLGGEVTDAGAGTVSERGVVYVAGNGTPTTSDTQVIIGAGTGSFAQAVTNLSPSTTYSVRAYAINQAGTSYGATQIVSTGNSLAITSVTPSAVCAGATISVAYTNSSPGTTLTVYLNGPSTSNLSLTTLNASQASGTITATIPADRLAGQYSVYLSGGGVTSGSANVTVNAIPPAPTVVSSIIYCQNVVASPLSATGQGLRWYTAGGTGSSTAPTPPTSVAGTTNYYVSQTINGCESPRATLTVTVTPLPAAPTTTPVTVCQNTTPVSLATGVTAAQGASLQWYTAATGGTASANAPVPPTSTVGSINYYVSQVINGCESPRAALTYMVNPLPGVTLTNDGPLSCTRPAVTLTAGGNGSAYRFSSGATPIGTGNQATVSLSGTYSVTLTDGNGCSATAQTEVGSDQSNPQAGLTNDGPLTCAKTTVTLTAAGNGSYQFSAGSTPIGNTNQATVSTGGVYSVTVTAPNGCSATAQTTVEVNTSVAVPTLTASAVSTENAPINVTASGCSGTINWMAMGGTGTANGAVYTFTQPGNYVLTATCTVGTCTSPAAPSLSLQIRPGGFAISGVELVRCQLVDAGRGQYEVSLTPQYSGLSGSPVSFGITNELAVTTAPGPYTIRLYTDNPAITLTASQADQQASYRYSWLAACNNSQPAPNRAPVAQSIPDQVLVVGQPYQLELSSYFTDPDGQVLTFTATGLPAGLQLSGSRISGSPTQAGTVTVNLTALDPGGLQAEGNVVLRVDPAPITPTPGVFSIAGVTGVRCETVTASERRLIFSPVYTGLTGEPISFGITNEVAPTTAPGPYAVRLYTDNPAITLTAVQGSAQASYRYNWLAACATPANGRQAVAEAGSQLSVVVLGNPVVGESVEIVIGGVEGQAVELSLTDLAGNQLHHQSIRQAAGSERVTLPVSARQAITILKVSTATQHQTVKLIRQ